MVFQIEQISSGLGPSAVKPPNAPKRPKLSFAAVTGDQVVFKDGIRPPHTPLQVALWGNAQLLPEKLADPLSQFRKQPVDNRVGLR